MATKKIGKVIEPIDADLESVVERVVRPTHKSKKIKELAPKVAHLGPPIQEQFFHVEKQAEVNGIEMGVLDNGIPYLSEAGLAKMCGIDRKVLNRLAVGWSDEKHKERGTAINELLEGAGYFEPDLFLRSELNGSPVNAYTEPVCMAVLEYYAFITKEPREDAQRAFRTLARTTFRMLVYQAVGYSPEQKVLDSWRHFHDRVDMTATSVPLGYFSVFKEIAIMLVPMIRAGIFISDKVVPDISVGQAWSSHWETNDLAKKYGDRQRYSHEYPLYYPQSKSNPQPAYCYPEEALGSFRAWLQATYIRSKFPAYMLGQTKKGSVPLAIANKALGAFGAQQLEAPKKRIR